MLDNGAVVGSLECTSHGSALVDENDLHENFVLLVLDAQNLDHQLLEDLREFGEALRLSVVNLRSSLRDFFIESIQGLDDSFLVDSKLFLIRELPMAEKVHQR